MPINNKTSTPPETKLLISGIGVRLLACVYDGLLIIALLFFVSIILVVLGTSSAERSAGVATVLPAYYRYGIMLPLFFLTVVGFYGVFWRKAGQTLGMQTWRLKTITAAGQHLNWWQSFSRCSAACCIPVVCGMATYALHHHAIAMLISVSIGFIFNYVFALFNRHHLAFHDILSKTMTLRLPVTPK